MRWLAVLSIAALVVIATAGSQALAALRGGSDTPKLAELVFVTEDRPDQLAGCDMISVMQTESNEAVFRAAKTISSPARLASTSDFSSTCFGSVEYPWSPWLTVWPKARR